MLEVKVILHNAVTGEVREIANMTIVNDGTGKPRAQVGNYDVKAWEAFPPPTRGRRCLGPARVEEHERRRSVWALVYKALEALYEKDTNDCSTCRGSGMLDLPLPMMCADCNGSGREL